MSKIISIGTSVPKYKTDQSEILNFMHHVYQNKLVSRKLNSLFANSGIYSRYSSIPDFNKILNRNSSFGIENQEISVKDRLDIFKERAIPLARNAVESAISKTNSYCHLSSITHIITVSCTGIYAPGLDSELIVELNLRRDIFHTSINFLGCNAAFHALKIADMISNSDEKAIVLIVCVELCTLHFQAKNNHDNLLSNTIFGDGAAALILTSNSYSENSLEIKGFYSLLLDKGKELMGWNITPQNFEMILDSKIPDFIGKEIRMIVLNSCKKLKLSPNEISQWAIHPGGKKILDTIKASLNLKYNDLKVVYNVLENYGNMSSPTVLFVLRDLFEKNFIKNELIYSIGFGPGLSIESAIFSYSKV